MPKKCCMRTNMWSRHRQFPVTSCRTQNCSLIIIIIFSRQEIYSVLEKQIASVIRPRVMNYLLSDRSKGRLHYCFYIVVRHLYTTLPAGYLLVVNSLLSINVIYWTASRCIIAFQHALSKIFHASEAIACSAPHLPPQFHLPLYQREIIKRSDCSAGCQYWLYK